MISIPEPCNEDFSKMTSTERGAFCGKCQIDTFDFRDLEESKINQILLENKGEHLCGQFSNGQLSSLNKGFIAWNNQKKETFRSKFVLALVLVFGLALFSCNTQEEKAIIELQTLELMSSVQDKQAYINDIQNEQELDLVEFIEEEELVLEQCEMHVAGGISYYEEEIVEPVPADVGLRGNIQHTLTMLGGAMVAVDYIEYLEDTVAVEESESILPEVIEEDMRAFEANAFPNPTASDATLALDITVEGQFEIMLFDMSGRLVRSIYSGVLVEGRQNFPIELAEAQSGMYIIKVLSNGQNESLKIQKLN